MSTLQPPFSEADGVSSNCQLSPCLPATYHNLVYEVYRVDDSISEFLKHDLVANRLDDVYTWLWLAGRKMSARPLHRQLMYKRNIIVTEQIDLHLVWFDDTIYIKPLPEYLLNHNFWSQHLCSTSDLHKSALGLLLSYSWFVCHVSDFHIAKDCHLLPEAIKFKDWTHLMGIITGNMDNAKVHRRYHYGELRLARLNLVYRWTFTRFIRGYHVLHHQYASFFSRHFSWVTITSFAYFALVLTAMQVGLATSGLKDNVAFNNISQWCAVLCIAFPLLVIAVVVSLFGFYVSYNAVATVMHQQSKRREERKKMAGNPPSAQARSQAV